MLPFTVSALPPVPARNLRPPLSALVAPSDLQIPDRHPISLHLDHTKTMASTVDPTSATPAGAVAHDPELVAALSARNATFATLLSLIPQQYYVGPSEEQLDSRWLKNKKRKTGEEIKEHKESKRRLREVKVGCIGGEY